jgi:hypothetical protein
MEASVAKVRIRSCHSLHDVHLKRNIGLSGMLISAAFEPQHQSSDQSASSIFLNHPELIVIIRPRFARTDA